MFARLPANEGRARALRLTLALVAGLLLAALAPHTYARGKVVSSVVSSAFSGEQAGSMAAFDHRIGASGADVIAEKATRLGKIEAIRRMSVAWALPTPLRVSPGHSGLLANNVENMADSATKFVALCEQAAFNQMTFLQQAGQGPPLATS